MTCLRLCTGGICPPAAFWRTPYRSWSWPLRHWPSRDGRSRPVAAICGRRSRDGCRSRSAAASRCRQILHRLRLPITGRSPHLMHCIFLLSAQFEYRPIFSRRPFSLPLAPFFSFSPSKHHQLAIEPFSRLMAFGDALVSEAKETPATGQQVLLTSGWSLPRCSHMAFGASAGACEERCRDHPHRLAVNQAWSPAPPGFGLRTPWRLGGSTVAAFT